MSDKYQRTPEELWEVSHAKESGTPEPEWVTNHRMSRVINRDYVRRWALDYCATHAMPSKRKKIRVSEMFLNIIEAATKSAIIHRIESHSSKGKTLQ
jgi:hypothetical protein